MDELITFRENQKVYISKGATDYLSKYLEKDKTLYNIDEKEATILEKISDNEYRIRSSSFDYETSLPVEFIKKIKRKANWWLEDQEFISRTEFHDLYYMETLCKYVSNMVKNIPIPVLTSYDKKNKAIYFSIGRIKKGFPIDVNIAYFDYTTLIKKWLRQFFPSYEVELEVEVGLTEEEILDKVRIEKVDLNDALLMKKKEKVIEKGVIEKITILKDEFILNRNDGGIRELRMSGSVEYPMSLSTFMDKLKNIQNQMKRYDFIFENSHVIRELRESTQDINISYQGEQLINFFKINFDDMRKYSLEKIDDFHYQWGVFKIRFESVSLRNDCLNFYNNEMEKLDG